MQNISTKLFQRATKFPFFSQYNLQKSLNYFSSIAANHQSTCNLSPLHPLPYNPSFITDKPKKYEISSLTNGIKVLTELWLNNKYYSIKMLYLGVLFNVGGKHEKQSTLGSLALLKQQFLQTNDYPSGMQNLLKLQSIGSQIFMDFDQETTYFKVQLVPSFKNEILDILLKCTCELRQFQAINNIYVNEQTSEEQFIDLAMNHAYQNLMGSSVNKGTQTNKNISNFFEDNFCRDNIIISAAGIQNHQKFCDDLNKKLEKLNLIKQNSDKKLNNLKYQGGELKIANENPLIEIAIFFESYPWSNENVYCFSILNTLLGNSSIQESFSSGGPGKGMHSRTTYFTLVLNRHYFVQSAAGIHMPFKDSGIFGIQGTSSYETANLLLEVLLSEMKDLSNPISDEELWRAKNCLKAHIFLCLERQSDRLEEATKNLMLQNNLSFKDYSKNIDKVSQKEISNEVKKMLKTKPTFVMRGKNCNKLHGLNHVIKC